MSQNWRDVCRPIIAEVLEFHKDSEEKVIRRALKAVYPFGQRKYHPYKIWLDEIKVQLGKRKFGNQPGRRPLESLPGQMSLIQEGD